MQECSSPRNSQPKTHSDEALGWTTIPAQIWFGHRSRFSDALENSYARALGVGIAEPRQSGFVFFGRAVIESGVQALTVVAMEEGYDVQASLFNGGVDSPVN